MQKGNDALRTSKYAKDMRNNRCSADIKLFKTIYSSTKYNVLFSSSLSAKGTTPVWFSTTTSL